MAVSPLLSALADMGFQAAGASGQKRLGRLAYEVYLRTKAGRGAREWIDMTQREQEEWYVAVADVLKQSI